MSTGRVSTTRAARALCALTALVAVSSPKIASAEDHPYIEAESVDNYQNCCFPKGSTACNLYYANSGASYFRSTMTDGANDVGFRLGAWWEDSSVYDSDFMDPDLCPGRNFNDTGNFDAPGLGISYYQGHGYGLTKPVPDEPCDTMYGCYNPPAGTSVGNTGYGACVLTPWTVGKWGAGWGICNYTSSPALATCGAFSANSQTVSLNSCVALGENTYNGGWRGAGTNGGTSLAIVWMSFGMWTFFPTTEWNPVYAGLHLYAGIMISDHDVSDNTPFGYLIADAYNANPSAAVSQGYVDSMSSNYVGSGCSGDGFPAGGMNGCGCNAVMTLGTNGTYTYNAFNENWYALRNDLAGLNGTGYWYWSVNCNYNLSQYPWYGGDHT